MKCFTFHHGVITPGIFVSTIDKQKTIILGDDLKNGRMVRVPIIGEDLFTQNNLLMEGFFQKRSGEASIIKPIKEQNGILLRIITFDQDTCPWDGKIDVINGKVFPDRLGYSSSCIDALLTVFEKSSLLCGNLHGYHYVIYLFEMKVNVAVQIKNQ